jgi:polyhydroxybutyrate depolymerase
MKTLTIFFLAFWISILTLAVAFAQGDDYSLFKTRKELRSLDAKVKPIKEAPTSLELSRYGPGDYERNIDVGGRVRRYEMHIPPGYTKDRPWPVVINYHGGGGRAATARLESGLDSKADSAGFIAVYPDGSGLLGGRLLTWNAGECCGYAMKHSVDDVGFTRALLDDLARLFHIDSRRIYATGLSNGAFMTYRLACELSDRIAAIAPVAGVMVMNTCKPSRPVSVLHFHGTADPAAPYKGGIGDQSISKTNFPSVSENILGWLQRNGINPKPVKKEKEGNSEITEYRGEDGTEIVLVTIAGGGHTWPGGKRMLSAKNVGALDVSFSANDMMWDFFQRHPLKLDKAKNFDVKNTQ